MIIRKATEGDLAQLLDLDRGHTQAEANLDPTTDILWLERPQGKAYCRNLIENILVAMKNDKIIGFLCGYEVPPSPWRRIFTMTEINSLYIHPQHRGKGIGSELMRKFVQEYQHKDRIKVTALANNNRAIEFYEGNGFISHSIILERDLNEE